jgi:glyoxylase-like metal-dependent hydrolase (beta-lactamase superfamily II)
MGGTMRVGNVEVVALSDGGFTRAPGGFMPEVPAEAWEQYRAQHLDAEGNIRLNLGCFLVRSSGRTILVDTGIGGRGGGNFPPGRLMDELRAASVKPEEIERVVITHMHFDHIGWNTIDREGHPVATFSKARYIIQWHEWDYWSKQDAAKQTMATLAFPIERAGQLNLVDPNHHPTPELTMLPSPGHTPGHVSILISSGGEQAVILGDVAHSPVQVTEPDWSIVGDVDKDLGRQSRRALWDRIEQEGLRVAAGHFTGQNLGRFVRLEGKRHWQAL